MLMIVFLILESPSCIKLLVETERFSNRKLFYCRLRFLLWFIQLWYWHIWDKLLIFLNITVKKVTIGSDFTCRFLVGDNLVHMRQVNEHT